MIEAEPSRRVPGSVDELEAIVRHVLGFGVPDSLSQVRAEICGTNIVIHFRFEHPENPLLIEEAQIIGTEITSHVSWDMRISEHVTFATEPAPTAVGRLVFDRDG